MIADNIINFERFKQFHSRFSDVLYIYTISAAIFVIYTYIQQSSTFTAVQIVSVYLYICTPTSTTLPCIQSRVMYEVHTNHPRCCIFKTTRCMQALSGYDNVHTNTTVMHRLTPLACRFRFSGPMTTTPPRNERGYDECAL